MADKDKPIETAPDPDEEDLDDLDDVLDQFQAKPTAPTQPKPTTTLPPPPSSAPDRPHDTAVTEDADLAASLQAGMSSLIGELGENPEMQQKFEDMMAELIAAGAAPSADEAAEHVRHASDSMPKEEGSGKKGGDDFQETIRRTMERMQASGDKATQAASSESTAVGGGASEEEMLAQMMKELGAGGGEGGEEDFNKMLMGMMAQLTNKEILYEPMKELDTKFPGWMEKNRASTKKEELEKYEEQQRLVREIVGRFERDGYKDENEDDREFIVERMQKVSAISA